MNFIVECCSKSGMKKKAAAAQRIFQAYALPKKKKQFEILYTVFLTAASHETRVFLVNYCA